ncbi:MAG: hypothetical protein FJ357_00930 [Thaumarchaeota archaeon]|nr:hypothetical protein [Nitrososphaerota archaeon]
MTKHMNRANRDGQDRYNKNISSEDEWSHIADEIKQTELQDPMAPKERIIEFSNRFSHTTKEDAVRAKSKEFADQINNTDQYFKFANGMIKERLDRLQQIKQDEQRFLGEVSVLQNKIKTRYELEKLNPKHITIDNMKNLLTILEDECEKMKDRLLYQELIVQRTKDEITIKRDQIEKIKTQLQSKMDLNEPLVDPIMRLKVELVRSGIPETDRIYALLDRLKEQMHG